MRIGLITCRELPEPDPDEDLLLAALRSAGVHASLVAWDGGGEPADFDLCCLRSCWNYHRRPDAFLDWVAATARETRLVNPEPVVRWNLHKRYLAELEARGTPIVPTAFLARGERASLAATAAARGWTDVVVKPAISAGSFRTRRFGDPADAAAQRFLDELVRSHDAMVQPTFEGEERAVVWIAGELTHAVAKSPRFAGEEERVSGALPVAADEADLAARVLALAPPGLLYARIDTMRTSAGALHLSELELIEPSLFLLQSPAALDRFVAALRG